MEAAELRRAREIGARLAAKSDISDIRLLRSSVDLERMPELGERMTWDLDIHPTPEYAPGADNLIIHCDFALSIRETGVAESESGEVGQDLEDESSETPDIARIQFRYSALFSLGVEEGEPAFSEQELEGFATSTGVFALYPYAREFIQDATTRAGLPPLVLNFFKIGIPKPISSDASGAE